MAELDETGKRLTLKLVYYGPAQSGKTTNLTYLHDHLLTDLKGEMMALETKGDRTLFFDLLPLGMKCPSGLLIKIKLFTVPGQVAHDSTRKAVLSRADGVVFVADSQTNQSVNNLESFENLAANIGRVGLDMEALPIAIQFNKRDLPDVVAEEDVIRRWSQTPWPVSFATALNGKGVVETFSALLEKVFVRVDSLFELHQKHQVTRQMFIEHFGKVSG